MMKKTFIFVLLVLVTVWCQPVVATAAPVLVNRTVLTVQNEVYTAPQAELWLAMWSQLVKVNIPIESIWNANADLDTGSKQQDFFTAYRKWPRDARELLYLALVWGEIKRLNLFTVSETDIDRAVANLKKTINEKTVSEAVRPFLQPEASTMYRNLVERSLRALTYLKVRGDLAKNPSLANVFWSWHLAQKTE